MTERRTLGKDWLTRDRDAARLMGRKGGQASAAKRPTVRSDEYKRGYDNGWRTAMRTARELYSAEARKALAS